MRVIKSITMNKGMGFLRKFLIILFFYTAVITEGYNRGRSMSMKWSFSGPLGSMQDLGLIGDQGEFYFHPAKRAHLHISSSAIDSPLRIPICFWPKVISPSGSDLVSIVEMKHRQLLQDVGEGGLIGFAYLSSANQKISLIGTLMQVKKTRSLSDGRVLVMVESIKRFFFDIFTQEVPYHIAVVRPFSDICNHISERDDLQVKLCNLAQLNMKLLSKRNPSKTHSFSEAFLKFRPRLPSKDVRTVHLYDQSLNTDRSSLFSFSVMEMMQITPTIKLSLMQDVAVEDRMKRLLPMLQSGCDFLQRDLLNQHLLDAQDLKDIEDSITCTSAELEAMHRSLLMR